MLTWFLQKINLTGSLDYAENRKISFIIEEAKVTSLDFSQGTGKCYKNHFSLM